MRTSFESISITPVPAHPRHWYNASQHAKTLPSCACIRYVFYLCPRRDVRRRRAPGDRPRGGRPLRSDGSLGPLSAVPILRSLGRREESVAFPLVHTLDDGVRRVHLDAHALVAPRADHAGRASVVQKHARRDGRIGCGGRAAQQHHARNTRGSALRDSRTSLTVSSLAHSLVDALLSRVSRNTKHSRLPSTRSRRLLKQTTTTPPPQAVAQTLYRNYDDVGTGGKFFFSPQEARRPVRLGAC